MKGASGFLLPSPKPLPFSQDFFMRRQVPALSGTKGRTEAVPPMSLVPKGRGFFMLRFFTEKT